MWACVNAFAPHFYASCSRACTKFRALLTRLRHTQAVHLSLTSIAPSSELPNSMCAHTCRPTCCTSRRRRRVICTYRHAKCSTCLQCETLDIMQYFLCSLRAIDCASLPAPLRHHRALCCSICNFPYPARLIPASAVRLCTRMLQCLNIGDVYVSYIRHIRSKLNHNIQSKPLV